VAAVIALQEIFRRQSYLLLITKEIPGLVSETKVAFPPGCRKKGHVNEVRRFIKFGNVFPTPHPARPGW
jgi:hypothetical protein